MARPRNAIQTVKKTLYLPEPIHQTVEIMLLDTLTGRPRVGAWNDLVSTLLKDWIDIQRQQQTTEGEEQSPWWEERRET
jgi:hypothetical protein